MNALKENIIEKLDRLPDPTLQEVMDFVNFLAWRGVGEDAPLLNIAGVLSGEPISTEAIELELYGPASAE